jgi:hypothetical protein
LCGEFDTQLDLFVLQTAATAANQMLGNLPRFIAG